MAYTETLYAIGSPKVLTQGKIPPRREHRKEGAHTGCEPLTCLLARLNLQPCVGPPLTVALKLLLKPAAWVMRLSDDPSPLCLLPATINQFAACIQFDAVIAMPIPVRWTGHLWHMTAGHLWRGRHTHGAALHASSRVQSRM